MTMALGPADRISHPAEPHPPRKSRNPKPGWRAKSSQPELFDGLSEDRLLAFYAECTPRNCATPTEVLSQGEPALTAFLILEGRIEVTFIDAEGNTIIAHVAGPGEVMGELELLSGKTCAATCRTYANTRLLCFSAPLLTKHVPTDLLLRNFARILHGRLVRDNRLHAIAQYYPAEARICLHLWRMAGQDGTDIPISQAQLALLAGCSRQTVNRTLAQLRDNGTIEMRRGALRVLEPQRLSSRRLAFDASGI